MYFFKFTKFEKDIDIFFSSSGMFSGTILSEKCHRPLKICWLPVYSSGEAFASSRAFYSRKIQILGYI